MILLRCVGHRSRNSVIFNAGHTICFVLKYSCNLVLTTICMFRPYIDTYNPQGMQLRRFKNRTPARFEYMHRQNWRRWTSNNNETAFNSWRLILVELFWFFGTKIFGTQERFGLHPDFPVFFYRTLISMFNPHR
jgi:hypothetical protein